MQPNGTYWLRSLPVFLPGTRAFKRLLHPSPHLPNIYKARTYRAGTVAAVRPQSLRPDPCLPVASHVVGGDKATDQFPPQEEGRQDDPSNEAFPKDMDTAEGWEWRARAASFLEQECLGEAIPRGSPNYCPGFGPGARQVTCALLPPPPDSQLHSRLSASPSATSLPQFLIPFQTRGT